MKKRSFLVLVLFLFSYGINAQSSWTIADGDPTSLYNKCACLPVWGELMTSNQHNQLLYPSAAVSPMLGAKITKITFYCTLESEDWGGITGNIKLMHTFASQMPMGGIDATNATEVYAGTFVVADNIMTFNFFTPFTYTGGDLLIDITAYSKGVWAGTDFYGLTTTIPMGCCDGLPIYFYTKITFEYYPPSVNTYILSSSAGTGGTITPDGKVIMGEHQDKKYDFAPDENHIISKVLIDGVANAGALIDSYYVFTDITADHTIHAEFEPITGTYYTVTASAGTGGNITPSGNVVVPEHQNKKFSFFAGEDYILSKIWIDNVENPQAVSDGYYIFTDVTTNHTINAEFTATGGIIIVGDDTQINATVPVSTCYMDVSQHVQMIYPADFMAGLVDTKITKISYHASTAYEEFGGAKGTIKIMHTTANDLVSGFLNTDLATIVYTGYFVISGSWMEFPCSIPFSYTGGNLLIDVTTVAPPGEPRNIIFYGTPTSNISRYSFTFEGVYYNDLHQFTPKTKFKYTTAEINSYTIAASASTGGSISPSGNVVVTENQNKRFDFYPNQNYTLSKVLIDDVENPQAVSDGYYIFTNVTEDHTIHAEFTFTGSIDYIITATASAGGTINPNGEVSVPENGSQKFDFQADQNYILYKVLIDNVENTQAVNDGYYIFTNVTKDHTIHAEFAPESATYYTITASAGAGGTINPNGNVSVLENTDQKFDFYPDTNHILSKVLIDNVENAQAVNDGYYIFTDVTKDHTIHAEFLQKDAISEESLQSIHVYVYQNSLYVVNEHQIPLQGIEIIDITGRVVYNSSVVTSPINLNLAKGIYMVRLLNKDFICIKKIII